jgi:hypothetical protein
MTFDTRLPSHQAAPGGISNYMVIQNATANLMNQDAKTPAKSSRNEYGPCLK